MVADLGDGYTVREIDRTVHGEMYQRLGSAIFTDAIVLNTSLVLTDEEKHAVRKLATAFRDEFQLRWGIYDIHGEAIGWTWGHQMDEQRFYMKNTTILPEHQGKGIYTRLLPHVLARLRQEGFQIVFSRHHMGNNAVIVPKLKAGFVISGMEIDDVRGALVVLTYHMNTARRHAMAFRTGERKATDDIRTALGM